MKTAAVAIATVALLAVLSATTTSAVNVEAAGRRWLPSSKIMKRMWEKPAVMAHKASVFKTKLDWEDERYSPLCIDCLKAGCKYSVQAETTGTLEILFGSLADLQAWKAGTKKPTKLVVRPNVQAKKTGMLSADGRNCVWVYNPARISNVAVKSLRIDIQRLTSKKGAAAQKALAGVLGAPLPAVVSPQGTSLRHEHAEYPDQAVVEHVVKSGDSKCKLSNKYNAHPDHINAAEDKHQDAVKAGKYGIGMKLKIKQNTLPRVVPWDTIKWTKDDFDVVARTLYGECRGCPDKERQAIIEVIKNRATDPHFGGHGTFGKYATPAEVCKMPKQFSCWNKNDPNRPKMDALKLPAKGAQVDEKTPNGLFRKLYDFVVKCAVGDLKDANSIGRRGSYFVTNMKQKPNWYNAKRCDMVIGHHTFCQNRWGGKGFQKKC